jgi:hypothetical protein
MKEISIFSETLWAFGLTQSLTEMSSRNFLGIKGGLPALKADNFSTICLLIV